MQIEDVKNKDADLAKARERYDYMVQFINKESEADAKVLQEKINQNEAGMVTLRKQSGEKMKTANGSLLKLE